MLDLFRQRRVFCRVKDFPAVLQPNAVPGAAAADFVRIDYGFVLDVRCKAERLTRVHHVVRFQPVQHLHLIAQRLVVRAQLHERQAGEIMAITP